MSLATEPFVRRLTHTNRNDCEGQHDDSNQSDDAALKRAVFAGGVAATPFPPWHVPRLRLSYARGPHPLALTKVRARTVSSWPLVR